MKSTLLPLLALVASASLAEPSRSPMEWHSVETNSIARWKSERHAPSGVVVDEKSRSVCFLAEATGVGAEDAVEFMVIGPLSDRAYEAMFVSVASPSAIAAALERVGMPRGKGVDMRQARFWPQGEKVTLKVAPWLDQTLPAGGLSSLVNDLREKEGETRILSLPLSYTGGERDAAGELVANTNMPCAVFAVFNHGPSLLQFDGKIDQSAEYGRFVTRTQIKKGALYEFTLQWDGKRRVKEIELAVNATNAVESVNLLKRTAEKFDVYARLAFDSSVTVERASDYARAFSMLDGNGIKMNGIAPGQFFFRAFLPDPVWRDRPARIFQPFEIRLRADGVREFTFVEEDWSGEGLDPVLKPHVTVFKDWNELPALISKTGDQGAKIYGALIYAPKSTPVTELFPIIPALSSRISVFYVFGE